MEGKKDEPVISRRKALLGLGLAGLGGVGAVVTTYLASRSSNLLWYLEDEAKK